MRLSVKALALAAAILCGAGIFMMTWWLIIIGQSGAPIFFTRLYPGYCVSPLGSLIGIPYAFVDGLIFGALLAWLYNLFVPKEAKA